MTEKIGRNDPCPCGSGKKYKQCCANKAAVPGAPRKITAKWLSGPKPINLMERTFGAALEAAQQSDTPPLPPEEKEETETQ